MKKTVIALEVLALCPDKATLEKMTGVPGTKRIESGGYGEPELSVYVDVECLGCGNCHALLLS